MKKLILLLLLIPSLAWGQVSTSGVSLSGCSSGGASAAAYSFGCASATSSNNTSGLLCEDFDNPTQTDCNTDDGLYCRAAWSATTGGSPNFAYAGATGNALLCDGSSETTSDGRMWTEGTNDPEYIYFTFNALDLTADVATALDILIIKYNNCASDLQYIQAYYNGTAWTMAAKGFGGTIDYTTTTITEGTTYHVWVKIVKGASGTVTLMFNTSATRPTDWDTCTSGHNNCASSAGTRDAYADCLKAVASYVSASKHASLYFDNILVSASEIGSNP